MKIKLLKRLRKKYPIKYSKENLSKKRDSNTGEAIGGKFVVTDPFRERVTNVYHDTIEPARDTRREVILKAVQQKRYSKLKIFKIIE